MLVSRRHHAPFDGVRLELDRALAPSWIARRVLLCGVAQDEHLTTALGRGTAAERSQLKIVLSGRLEVNLGTRSFDLGPGEFVLVPRIADCLTRGGDHETLELDWDPGAPIARTMMATAVERGALGARARAAAQSIADALACDDSADGVLGQLARSMPHALEALAAEGLPLDGSGAEEESAHRGVDQADQCLLTAIDRTLANLEGGPAAVELEQALRWSRRTVSRRTQELHARYGLSGIDGEGWRAVRDFYRILVGTILASNPRVTTRTLASLLGYASPDALCHAFANAGLPSPGAVKKVATVRAVSLSA